MRGVAASATRDTVRVSGMMDGAGHSAGHGGNPWACGAMPMGRKHSHTGGRKAWAQELKLCGVFKRKKANNHAPGLHGGRGYPGLNFAR